MAKEKKTEDGEMSFWGHLEELRWHIMRSVIAVLVLSIVAFLNRKFVFDYLILSPANAEFFTNRMLCKIGEFLHIKAICMDQLNLKIININMSGQFLTHMYISFITGLIVAFPFVLNEFWRFIRPALHKNEARYSGGAVFISSLLFFLGVLFSYFLIVPLTINFLGTYQVSPTVTNQISLQSYISTVISVIFAVGLVFELPILIYFLTKIGLITPAFMRKNRKYTIVVLLVLSAVITPPDVFSQVLVCIPLIGLYEISILVSDRIYKKQQLEFEG